MINSVNYEGGGKATIEFTPSKLIYNKDGIPVLSVKQIEAVATELLQNYCPQMLARPGFTPIAYIIDKLRERTGLLFVQQDLGYIGTAKVLGKVAFRKKILFLDNSLFGDRKQAFRFTAAHEIGHWILHRYNYRNWTFNSRYPTSDSLEDDEKTLCRLDQKSPKDWLEFQANVFAASLIMPREMFVLALATAQAAMGITKNIGRIYLSQAPCSLRDCENAVSDLAKIFEVSKQSVRVRIKTLNLINLAGPDSAYGIWRF
jgi:hypothetical protein